MELDFRIPRDRAIILQNTIASGGSEADPFIQYLNADGLTIDESNKGYSSAQIDYSLSIFATCTNCIIDISGTNDHRTEASNDDLNTGLAAGNIYTLNDVLGEELHTDLNAANDSATEAITAFADHAATIDGATKVTIGQDITAMLPQGAEVVANGDFANWTTDNPDGWTLVGESGSDPMVTEVSGKCRIYTSSGNISMYQNVLTKGKYYVMTFDCTAAVTGTLNVYSGAGTVYGSVNIVRSKVITFRADSSIVGFKRNSGATDITIDNVSVKELEVLGADLVTDGDFGDVTLAAAKGVAGITKAAPAVVTFDAAHGYIDGDVIYFSGLTEMTELNTEYWVLRSNAGDTFELQTTVGNSLDTSGYGAAETTGGAVAQHTTHTSWTDGVGWNPGVDGAGALTGTANCDGTQTAASYLYQDIGMASDYTYLIKYTISNRSAGTIRIVSGTIGISNSSDGTYTELLSKAFGNSFFNLQVDVDFIGSIDNVSVHKLLVTKDIESSAAYSGDHCVLPVDVNNFAIPVTYAAEAIVAQKITGETNAITGWTQVGLDAGANVFESQDTTVNDGVFALHADCNDTPTSVARFYKDIEVDLGISNGDVVKLSFKIRHTGVAIGQGFWRCVLAAINSGSNNTIITVVYTTTSFVEKTYYWTHDANYKYLLFKEVNTDNDGGIYVDAISIKKVTFT